MVLGRVEVDDRCDTIHMNSACGYVGGDESVDTALAEVGQRPGALRLAATTMDGGGLETFLAQLAEPWRVRQKMIAGQAAPTASAVISRRSACVVFQNTWLAVVMSGVSSPTSCLTGSCW